MKKWSMAFIVCLELISNATRANGPKEFEMITKKIAAVESPMDNATVPAESINKRSYYEQAFDHDANKAKDFSLVKSIRNELLNDNYLSKSGRNVQIIVVGKEITLKGPVPSEGEKTRILDIANRHSENKKIRDQLEVIRQ
ncbi:MAG: BON domain-containing protein [Bacteriovorax sp.]